ncbi:MAG TPA: response regulator [Pyrinomonadaceae bacterium]|jgi:signal transduction histidine kinase/ActR/RegA family two-component response regulator|nr:response regulator [Pyrinomonadaceae bacterium]
MSDKPSTTRNRFFGPFLWVVTGAGCIAFLYSFLRIDLTQFDSRFAVLVAMALMLTSRITVPIPRLSSQISVSDTLVFLALLLYGAPAAIIVASLEAFVSSLRFSRKRSIVAFNWASAAVSVFITGSVLQATFGDVLALRTQPLTARFAAAIWTMALTHYVANSGIVGIGAALKTNEPIWSTWRKHYLWTSITYFSGAMAAGVIAGLVYFIGAYAFVIALPIIAIVFLTYSTYLRHVETSAAQAAQAEKHVKELSHYIAEQERIREQFSQMEKLSALGELASGVAHDFNNTLAGILGRAQLLQRTDDPEKIHRGLDIIIKTAEDGAKTVKRIQDFARQRRDHDFELVSIDQILMDASEITRPRWKNCAEASNIHITLDLQIGSNAMVMGDDSELREVLVNMVFNATDAMPEGGTLTLSTRTVGEQVVIKVIDTGVGMYPEVRSRIFDPFFTTKGKAGVGLGLAVSFGIIRRHGGNVEVESQYGKGTEFRITLPVAKIAETPIPKREPVLEEPDSQPALAAAQVDGRVSRRRLLVVDDEDFVRELLRDILDSENCEVEVAQDGTEALALFRAREFDGVFTDVGMPGMSGWELAREIRQLNNQVPIGIITGWGEIVGSNEQRAAGVDWVVAKPFTAERIAELVCEINNRTAASRKENVSTVAA